MRTRTTIMLAALALGGCEDKNLEQVSTPPAPPLDTCAVEFTQFITFGQSGVNTSRLSPGDSTTLRPKLYQGPAIVDGDNACIRDLVVTPGDGADDDDYTLTKLEDGSYRLTVSEDATPGGSFKLSAGYGSSREIGDIVYVYDTERWPLEGVWSQPRKECGASSIGELEINRGGFSVTWQPFESYKDYWGSYTFDRAESDGIEGTLVIEPSGGNFMPFGKNQRTLQVRVDGDMLTILDGDFGQHRSGQRLCEAPFRRRG